MISKYQSMWLLVLFDLPVLTKKERKVATQFRNQLITEGYIMIQYSCYLRHCPTRALRDKFERRLSKIIPEEGFVVAFTLTDAQYADAVWYYGTTPVKPQQIPGLFDEL